MRLPSRLTVLCSVSMIMIAVGCATDPAPADTISLADVGGFNTEAPPSPTRAPSSVGTGVLADSDTQVAPASPPLAVFVCLDASASYPPALLLRARETLAQLLLQQVQPGRDTIQVWVRWITAASRSEDAFLISFRVRPVPAPPVQPTHAAQPAKPAVEDIKDTFNRAAREKARAQWEEAVRAWEAEVARSDAAYQAALAEHHRALTDAQAQMQAGVERLRGAPPPPAAGSDVGGCTYAGARALVREPGNRLLLLISDLVPFGDQDTGELSLTGVNVRIAFFYCQRVAGCDEERTRWTPIFTGAGAASVDWFEPDEDIRTLLDN